MGGLVMSEGIRRAVAARRYSGGRRKLHGGVVFSHAYFNPPNATR